MSRYSMIQYNNRNTGESQIEAQALFKWFWLLTRLHLIFVHGCYMLCIGSLYCSPFSVMFAVWHIKITRLKKYAAALGQLYTSHKNNKYYDWVSIPLTCRRD